MDSNIHGAFGILFLILYLTPITSTTVHINSNSVLIALLDSHYTHLSELIEKALLLQTLEQTVSHHNITIFAPTNQALEQHLDPEFKRFLLQPGNLKSLQNLLLFHIIPYRVGSIDPNPLHHTHYQTLCFDENNNRLELGSVKLTRPDDIIRPDGLIHAIDKLLVPEVVQQEFNRRRSLTSISAVLPEGAPVVHPRANRLKIPGAPVPAGAPPVLLVYNAMGPGPDLAPAPGPGPGGSRHHFDGATQVKDFIQTLIHYGGYNELADILVNLTSLATEMGKLVSEGYVLTVLAPNDEAMAKLTTEQLSDSGAPERIMYYHMIPEYQTEESMYNSVRRFGQVKYDTLRLHEKVVAEEADGSVKFGSGEDSAYLFDPDIYVNGRISVQGIDGVLFPMAKTGKKTVVDVAPPPPVKVVVKQNRGKLLEVACSIVDAFGQDSQFTSCY